MLSLLVVFFQCVDHGCKVKLISKEVGIACVNDDRLKVMLFYIMRIRFLDSKKIFIRYLLLIWPFPLTDIFLQFNYRGMQINQQIRLDYLLIDDLKQSLVKSEFVFRQIDF